MIFNAELLERLIAAQIQHTIKTLTQEGPLPLDDHADYVMGACDLTSKLVEIHTMYTVFDMGGGIPQFAALFDPKNDQFILNCYGCDGVCPEINELLPEED